MKRKVFISVVVFITALIIAVFTVKVMNARAADTIIPLVIKNENYVCPYIPPTLKIKSPSKDYFFSESEKKLLQVNFSRSGPILTELPRYYSDGTKRYGNAMILTFDKNLFALSMTKKRTPNGINWKVQTDKLLDKITLAKKEFKVFMGYTVTFDDSSAKIFAPEENSNYDYQISVLLEAIQTDYNINLREQD